MSFYEIQPALTNLDMPQSMMVPSLQHLTGDPFDITEKVPGINQPLMNLMGLFEPTTQQQEAR